MFHVLDNAYHRAIDTKEKVKRAQRLESFIKTQNDLFSSTTYVNPEQDQKFNDLDQQFLQMIEEMKGNATNTGEALTGIKIAQ